MAKPKPGDRLHGVKKIEISFNTNSIKKLIMDNPDLPVILLTNSEVVADDYGSWFGQDMIAYKTKVLVAEDEQTEGGERIIDDPGDLEEYLERALEYDDDYEELTDEEADKRLKEWIKELEPYWTECICIYSTL